MKKMFLFATALIASLLLIQSFVIGQETTTLLEEPPFPPTPELIIAPSPGSGDTGVSYSYSLEQPEMELYQTVADDNTLRIENTGNAVLMDIKVSILGMPEDWYTISHGALTEILPGELRRVDITFHPPSIGTFNYEINITSDQDTVFVGGTLVVKELTPQAMSELEAKKTEEQKAEEAKRTINVISVLLVAFGILGPAIVAIYMLTFLLRKRCPLCGSRMAIDYKGKNFVTYRCPTCNYFHTEEKEEKKNKQRKRKRKK
jgi:hypothetical protein